LNISTLKSGAHVIVGTIIDGASTSKLIKE
jgi:hypothetical protein